MNDQSNVPRLWARQGEAIVCARSQHPICELARDIYVGDARAGEDFTGWQQPEPDRTKSVADIRCTKCRSLWVRGDAQHGYQFNFTDGWR